MNVGSVEMNNTTAATSAMATMPRQEVVRKVQGAFTAGDSQVRKMVQEMQGHIEKMNVSLSFSTYGENGKSIAVSVINKDTGEVIREIPQKEIQSLYAKMRELAGMIFNTEA